MLLDDVGPTNQHRPFSHRNRGMPEEKGLLVGVMIGTHEGLSCCQRLLRCYVPLSFTICTNITKGGRGLGTSIQDSRQWKWKKCDASHRP